MFLELSEIFVCPACRPAQGLVVLVDELRESRVRRGHLGCPECQARFPIRQGVVDFGSGADPSPDADDVAAADLDAAELFRDVDREERATRVAALLAAPEMDGYLLFGRKLSTLARDVAGYGSAEIVSLAAGRGDRDAARGDADPGGGGDPDSGGGVDDAPPGGEGGVSRVRGVDPSALPIFSGRMAGAALLDPEPGEVEEAIRVLEHGGRLVVVQPSEPARRAVDDAAVEPVAASEAALVALRQTP